MNKLSKILFILMLLSSLGIVGLEGFKGPLWPVKFFKFVVLLSYIIPLSLRTNIDIAKAYYSVAIAIDKKIKGTIPRNS